MEKPRDLAKLDLTIPFWNILNTVVSAIQISLTHRKVQILTLWGPRTMEFLIYRYLLLISDDALWFNFFWLIWPYLFLSLTGDNSLLSQHMMRHYVDVTPKEEGLVKVTGRTFGNEGVVKNLCKILLGTLEYKLWLLGVMSQFAFTLSLGSC